MDQRIVDAEARLRKEKKRYAETVAAIQLECYHESVAECQYYTGEWTDFTLPPQRVCLECGLSEQGWGTGYKLLSLPPTAFLPREELYKLRAGVFIDDKNKGRPLHELLNEWVAKI